MPAGDRICPCRKDRSSPACALRGVPVPEFSHRQGLESVQVGVLEQFRGGAVAGPSGRRQPPLGKNLQNSFPFSPRIQDHVLPEKPFLQRDRPLLALGFQRGDRLRIPGLADPAVKFRDFRLFLLEMPVRTGKVENGRDEAFHDAPSARQAGESIKEILPPFSVPDHQHPHHLALPEQVTEFRTGVDAYDQAPGSLNDRMVRSVTEWVCESVHEKGVFAYNLKH